MSLLGHRCFERRPWVTAATLLGVVAVIVALGQMTAMSMTRNSPVMDGHFDDWQNVLSDPHNVLFDTVENVDPDVTGNPDRDYNRFAYTWDSTYLYFYFQRTAAASRAVECIVYMDRNYNGVLDRNDLVLDFNFNSGNTLGGCDAGLFQPYPNINSTNVLTGDGVIECAPEGGTNVPIIQDSIDSIINAMQGAGGAIGSAEELEQEMRVPWSVLGLSAGAPFKMHVSIGRGFSNNGQITDNFGPGDSGYTELALTPNRSSAAAPGTVVSYNHTLTQVANVTDTVDLTATSFNGWTTVVKNGQGQVITSLNLASSVTTSVIVEVTVPPGTSAGTIDRTLVEAVSRRDPLVRASVSDTTYVGSLVVYPDQAGTAAPGTSIYYPHKISNKTGGSLTVDLSSVSWSPAWATSVYDYTGLAQTSTVVVPAGSEVSVYLRVSVPTTATLGAEDVSELRAVARENTAYFDSARDVTTVYSAVDIRPDTTKFTTPGSVTTYQHTLTNSSGSQQTINLSQTSNPAWTVFFYDYTGATLKSSYTLQSNESTTVIMRISVPLTATAGQSAVTAITAALASSPATKDTATDRTNVVTLATFADPGFHMPERVFRQGDKVYAQAGGLVGWDEASMRWYNPSSVQISDSGSVVVVQNKVEHYLATTEASTPGTYTVALRNEAGAETTRTTFVVTYDSDFTWLRATDAVTASDTVSVDCALKNHNNASITSSFVEYRVWFDVNGDGAYGPGDQWIDSAGRPQPYAAGGVTHTTTGITIGAQGSYSEPGTGWTLSNKEFENWGMYHVDATWYTSGRIYIDSETAAFFSPGLTPAVRLTKALAAGQDAVVQVGQSVSFAVRVENSGDTTMVTIPLTDGFDPALLQYVSAIPPPSLTASGWLRWNDLANPGDIAPGQATTVTVNFTALAIPPSHLATNSVTTTAAVDSRGVFADAAYSSATVRVTRPQVQVTKAVSGNSHPRAGDVATYTIDVFNSGDTTITTGSLLDDWEDEHFDYNWSSPPAVPVGGSATFAYGPIAPGAHFYVTIELRAKGSSGAAWNTGTATGTDQYSDTVASAPSTATVTVTHPDISVSKTCLDADGFIGVGESGQFRIRVTNSGDTTITSALVSDTWTSQLAFVSSVPAMGVSGDVATCTVGPLDPGASRDVTITLSGASVGLGTNTATVSGADMYGNPLPSRASSATITVASPSISLTKTGLVVDVDLDGRHSAGDRIDYTFRVENTGNVPLTNVTVTDPSVSVSGGPILSLAPGAVDLATFTASHTMTQSDVDAGSFSNTATASGTFASSTFTGSSTVTTNFTTTPAAGMDKTADKATYATVGEQITYTYTITNTGNVTLSGPYHVADSRLTVPDVNSPATLAPGASVVATASHAVTQADLDAGSITNTATGTGHVGGVEYTSPADSLTVDAVQTPALSVEKSADEFTYSTVGEHVTYSYTITNTGNVTLSAPFHVSDDKVTVPDVVAPATLAPGANVVAAADHVVTQADLDAGSITNEATATGHFGGSHHTSAADSLTVDAVQTPAVTLDKTASTATYAAPGEKITYTYTITNAGNVTLAGPFHVTDSKITVPDATSPAFLAPGASAEATAAYVVTQDDIDGGSVTNSAMGTGHFGGTHYDSSADSWTANAIQAPSLSLAKSGAWVDVDSSGTYTAGDRIDYTFRVENTGNVTLTDVTVDDPLVTVSGGPIASMAPGAVDNTTFTAVHTIVQGDLDAGSFSNTASVTGTFDGDQYTADGTEVSFFSPAPELSVAKSGTWVDVDSSGTHNAGDRIDYTFEVRNTGNVTLTDITVDDPLVAVSGGPVLSLAPGAADISTFTAAYTITQTDVDAGFFTNTATATGHFDGDPYTGSGSDTTNFTRGPSVSLSKSGTWVDADSSGTYNAGDRVDYTFEVENTGNVTLTDVTVTDPKVTVSGGPIASMAPGAVDTTRFTASYTVTQDDMDAGSVGNTATATGTFDGDDCTGSGSTTTGLAQTPSVSIGKTSAWVDADSSGTYNAGDRVDYSFRIENTGNVSVTVITVFDPKVVVVGGPILSMAPGAVDTTTFTASYTITQADMDAGSLGNTATVTARFHGDEYTGDGSTTTDFTQTPSISLSKSGTWVDADASGTYNAGDRVDYTFEVENTGNVTLTGVTVTDPKVTVTGGPIASLAPGAVDTTTFTASYTVTQSDMDAGSVGNTATATGTFDGDDCTGGGSTTTALTQTPSISLSKSGTWVDADSSGTYNAGDRVDYTFEVENTGNVTLTGVTVTDPKVTVTGGPIASLAPGAVDTTTFTASYTVTQSDMDAGSVANTATATGTFDGDDCTGGGSTTTALTQTPSISLSKSGTWVDADSSGTYNAGDRVDYIFRVENTGNVTMTNVTVTDPKVTVSGGPIASLSPGAVDTTTFTASYTVTQDDMDAGSVGNTATATGTFDGDDYTGGGSTTTALTQTPSISLSKSGTWVDADASGTYNAGDRVGYTFRVENTGNVTLTDVTVTDPKVTVSGGPIASLAPGGVDTTTFTASYTVTQSDMDAGSVGNTATATGTFDGDDYTGGGSTTTNLTQTPTLTLSKSGTWVDADASGTYNAGDRVDYTFRVENTGNVTLTDVTVTDPKVTVSGGPIASLAPGGVDTTTFTASYTVTQSDMDAGSVGNTATATGTFDGDDYTGGGSTTTNLTQTPALTLSKSGTWVDADSSGTYNAGDRVGYTFRVENTGNVTLTDVTVTDPKVTVSGGPIASLAPGAVDSSTFTASYTVTQSDMDAGSVGNTATATGTFDGDDYTGGGSTTTALTQTPSISLSKSGTWVDADSSGTYSAGDRVDYTFRVENTGNVTLTDVTVTDPKVTVSGGPIASLAPGAVDTTTFTASYTITQTDMDTGSVGNTATATGTFDGDDYTGGGSTTTALTQTPSISLSKSGTWVDADSSGTYSAGDRVDYTFRVENTGNVTLTDVTVTDPKVTVSGGPSASLAPGAVDSSTFTASYTVTQSDMDAGSVGNTATATGTFDGDDHTGGGSTTTGLTQTPALTIDKTASALSYSAVGELITYSYLITNSGNVTLDGPIHIADSKLAVPDVESPASLAPGASVVTSVTHAVTQADLDAGSIVNTATGTGHFEGTHCDSLPDSWTASAVQEPSLALAKVGTWVDVDLSGTYTAGDRIDYSLRIENTGNVTLLAVTVTDPKATVSGGPLATLAPGAVDATTFTAAHVLTQADVDFGSFTNTATATGVFDGNDYSADGTELVNFPQAPEIQLFKSGTWVDADSSGTYNAGDRIDYTFEVWNTGSVTLTNVTVEDPLVAVTGGPILSIGPGAADLSTFTASYAITQTDLDAGFFMNTATATGHYGVGNETTGTGSETSYFTQTPALTLSKSGTWVDADSSGTYNAGDRIDYEFVVENTGNVTLTDVIVTDPKVTVSGGPIASLAPGAVDSSTFTAAYTITQSDMDAGSVGNTATATGTFDGDDYTGGGSTTTDLTQTPALTLSKSGTWVDADSSGTYNAGDRIDYTFEVENTGNVTLTDVTVTDPKVTVSGGPIASLAPGAVDSSTFTAAYTITQSDMDAGSVGNTATATGTFDGDDYTGGGSTTTALTQTPALTLSKSGTWVDADASGTYNAGDRIDYTFRVENTGNVTLADVTVTDPKVTVSGGPIASMAPGAVDTTTFTAAYTIAQTDMDAGSVGNTATATGTFDGDDYTGGGSTTTGLTQTPAVTLSKSGTWVDADASGTYNAGDRIDYEFVVANIGNVTLTGITVDDPKVAVSGGPLASLAPGAVDTTTFTASYTLTQPDLDAGAFANTATVTGHFDGSDVLNVGSHTANLPHSPALLFTKSGAWVDADLSGTCNSGDRVDYTFRVENTGNVTVTDVTVDDPKVTVSGGPIASLAPGAVDTTTFTASYDITQPDIDAGSVGNTAAIHGTYDGDDYAGSASTATPLPQAPALTLAKSGAWVDVDASGTYNAGDRIDYSFRVENTGNVTLTDVAVTDPKVTVSGGPVASLAPGVVDSATFNAAYTITQLDIDLGFVTNTATATGTFDGVDHEADGTEVFYLTPTPEMTLTKTGTWFDADSSGTCNAGDRIDYTFGVENTGNVTMTNVTVTDPKVTVSGGPIASLAPGVTDTTTFTASYTITQSDLDAGSVGNTATATGTFDGDDYTFDGSTTTDLNQAPSLTLEKTANTTDYSSVGEAITYSYKIINSGNVTISGPFRIVDSRITVDDVMVPVSLAPGASVTGTETYTITQTDLDAGSITNIATVTGTFDGHDQPSPPDAVTLTAVQSPGISLSKSGTWVDADASGTYSAGDRVDYTFRVENTGNVTLTDVTVTDPKVTVSGGPIASLAPGAVDTATFIAAYTITQSDMDAGSVGNTATATGTFDGDDYTGSGSTTTALTQTPALTLSKSGTWVDADASGTYSAGDRIDYEFVVENTGNVTLTGVTVTDPKVTVSGGPLASLAPGAVDTTTFTASYTITQADMDAGSVGNTATATGTFDGDDYTGGGSTTTALTQAPALTLSKSGTWVDADASGTYNAGDRVDYSFRLENTGNVTLTDVTVTDPKVTVSGGPIVSLAPGAVDSSTFTAAYTITQSDMDAGSVGNTATATGTFDGDDYTGGGSTTTGLTQTPALTLSKSGTWVDADSSGTYSAGDRVDYTFEVENTGNVTLTGVTVTDPKVTVSGGPIASLAPGAVDTTTFTASYTITQSDMDAGSVGNTATATGTFDGDDYTGGGSTTTNLTQTPSISLSKSGTWVDADSSGMYSAGDRIDYAFEVENTGNVTLNGVTVTDPKVTVSGGPIASLAPGAVDSSTFTAAYTVTQADMDAGSVGNTATATGTFDGDDYTGGGSTTTALTQTPALTLSKSGTWVDADASGTYSTGDRIDYEFVVENTGNVTLTDVTVTDPKVTVSGGPIASLAPGAVDSSTFTAAYTITQPDMDAGSVGNTATAKGTFDGDEYTADGSTTTALTQTPVISLSKSGTWVDADSSGTYSAGDRVDYTFEVENTGNVTLTDVTVTDPKVTVSGGPIASLAPGAVDTTTFTASYTITQSDMDAGSVGNTATATGTFDGDDYTGGGSTTTDLTQTPSISLSKSGTWVDADASGTYSAGDRVDYTFDVENTGNVTLTGVTVTDPKVTVSGGPIASLAPGVVDTTTFTASYTITQPDMDAGSVGNTATAKGTFDGDEYTADGSTTTALTQTPVISLSKSGTWVDADSSGTYSAGDRVDYTFEVENTGNVTMTNVTVTDPKVTVSGGPIASLAPGAVDTATFTASYTITQSDIDAGSVTNTAMATGTFDGGEYSGSGTEVVNFGPAPELTLVKNGAWVDADSSGGCSAGDRIDYTFAVANTGNVTLSNVTVTDPLVTVTGGPIMTLPPGVADISTFMGSHTVTQADLDAGFFTNTATVTGSYGGDDYAGTGSTTTDLTQTPKVALGKAPAPLTYSAAGDKIVYTYTVTNSGNVTLAGPFHIADDKVTVSDVVSPATLAPGASVVTSATYTITQADMDAGSVTNVATGTGDFGGDGYDSPPASATVTAAQTPSLTLSKSGTWVDADASGTYNAGDRIDYTFDVENTGNVTLTDVTVTDPKVTVSGGPIASLAPGAVDTTTFTASYTITQSDLDAGSVGNTATATGTFDGDDYTGGGSTTTALTQTPAISLSKSGTWVDADASGTYSAGDRIDYTFEVENTGNVTLTGVTVTDPKVTVSGGPIASLAPGAVDTTTFTASYTITQSDMDAGSVGNTATAKGTFDGDEYTGDGSTTTALTQTPSISLSKSGTWVDADASGTYSAGDRVDYTFEVENTGNVTLTGVTVTDPKVTVSGGPIASLAPGAVDTTTFTASYTITQSDMDAGSVGNTATAKGTFDGDEYTGDGSTTTALTQTPSISLSKSGTWVDADASGTYSAGDRVDYTFRVENTGNVTLTDVTVTDPKVTVSGGPIASLAPGAVDTTTFTAAYTITQSDMDAGSVGNTATATGTFDGDEYTGGGSTTTALTQTPSISLTKVGTWVDVDASGSHTVGDRVDYTFRVENTGNTTLTGVVVTDPLVAVSGGPIASLAPGAADTANFTASHTIVQPDLDAGGFTNTATATAFGPTGPVTADGSDTQLFIAGSSIRVTKTRTSEATATAGEPVTWQITVENIGNAVSAPVTIEDTWTAGAFDFASSNPAPTSQSGNQATWNIGTVPAHGTRTIQVALTAKAAVGRVSNSARSTTEPSNTDIAYVTIGAPSLATTKVRTSPATARAGDDVTWLITVTNSGDATATPVTVTDSWTPGAFDFISSTIPPADTPGPDSATFTIASVPPGQSAAFAVTLRATGMQGSHTNTAVGANPLDPDPTPGSDTVFVGASEVLVSKVRTSAAPVTVGDQVGWRISVRNAGNISSLPVTIEDSWTVGAFAFAEATPLQSSQVGNHATFVLGAIEAGGARSIDVTLTALAAGTQQNVAYSITTTSTVGTADVTVDPPVSSLVVAKRLADGQDATVAVGENARFTVTATNTGNTRITGASVVDTWDGARLSFVDATPGPSSLGSGVATFTVPAVLLPGDSWAFDVNLKVDSRPPGGVAFNTVTTAGVTDHLGDPVDPTTASARVNVPAGNPGVRVAKTYAPGHDATVTSGQEIAFVLSVENTGTTTVDVTMVDTWDPAFLDWAGASEAPDVQNAGSATFTVSGLAPGATHDITVRLTATGAGATSNVLTVTGTDTNGDPVSGLSSIPVTVVPGAVPALTLTKRLADGQDTHVQVGDTVRYTVVARNSGDSTITAGAIVDTWDPAYLSLTGAAPGAASSGPGIATFALPLPMGPSVTATYTLTFRVADQPATGSAANVARTQDVVDEFGTEVGSSQDSANLAVTAPAVSVTKALAPWQVASAAVGEPVAFRLTVRNSGDTVLPSIALSDTFDDAVLDFVSASTAPTGTGTGSLTWSGIGPLAPGEVVTVDTTFTVAAVPAGKTTVNDLTATPAADEFGDTPAPASESASIGLVTPGVTVTKRLAPGQHSSVYFGETVTYDVLVENTGDTTLVTVPLEDIYPAALLFGSASVTPDRVTPAGGGGGTVAWNDLTSSLGDLAPGASASVRLNFTANAVRGSVANAATVSGSRDVVGRPVTDSSTENTDLTITGPALPQVLKGSSPAPETVVMPGDIIHYRLSFENTTTVDIPGAVVRDVVPVEAEYVPGTLRLAYLTNSTFTDAADGDAGSFTAGTSTVAVNVGTLSAGTSGAVTFDVKVRPASISRPGIFNRFTLEHGAGQSGTLVSNTIRHPVDPFDITKSAADVNGGHLVAGDVVLWTIRVTNTGLIPTTHVVVTDDLPAGVTYVAGSITGTGASDANPRSLVWNVGNLPVGGEVTLTFKTTVDSGLKPGTEIRNFATVTSAEAPAKRSDDPTTGEVGDATMARTGDNDWAWLIGALALVLGGAVTLAVVWRRRIADVFSRTGRKVNARAVATVLGILLLGAGITVAVVANVDEVQYQLGLFDTVSLYSPPPGVEVAAASAAADTGSTGSSPRAGGRTSGRNRVVVPRLGIDVPIGEQEKPALRAGAWHQPGSASPDEGGNVVLAGHRRRGVFSLLHRLQPGDEILVKWEGATHRYTVSSLREAAPDERSVIMRAGTDRLTLYTCIPRFLGNKRTVVTAFPAK